MLGSPYGVLVEERPLAGITQFSLLSKRKPLGSEQYVRWQSYPVRNLWKDSFATFQFTMGTSDKQDRDQRRGRCKSEWL
jgi:hypothetical protein